MAADFRERSKFVLEDGKWMYQGGDVDFDPKVFSAPPPFSPTLPPFFPPTQPQRLTHTHTHTHTHTGNLDYGRRRSSGGP